MRRSTLFVTGFVFLSVFAVYCVYIMSLLGNEPIVSLPRISLLEELRLPTDKMENVRVLFVGDVHGQYHEMIQLFEKAGLKDTMVILLGDFLAKGPESVGVTDFILDHRDKVKCVLGNHDLAVMFAFLNPGVVSFPLRKKFGNLKPLEFTISHEKFIPDDMTKIKRMHLEISRQLGPEKMTALAQHCSAAIHLDFGEEDVYAVHAGLLPGDFNNRVPSIRELSEMKYVDKTNWAKFSKNKKNDNFIRWFKLWKDSKLPSELSGTHVLYGHDAAKGLNLKRHTIGLDTGCVKGGELSAMEFTRKSGKVTTKLHQVRCGGRRRAALLAQKSQSQSEERNVRELEEWNSMVSTVKSDVMTSSQHRDQASGLDNPKESSDAKVLEPEQPKPKENKEGESAEREANRQESNTESSVSTSGISGEVEGLKVLMPLQQPEMQKDGTHGESKEYELQLAS